MSFELSIEVSQQYDFAKEALNEIDKNPWVKNQWPLVYFIQNEVKRVGYVGESTNASDRIKTHLANPQKKNTFNKISIIGSDKFNKSATLDIESNLIQYMMSEGTYELLNGNYGLVNHNFYQKDLYKDLFKEIWKKLQEKKIVSKSLSEIENSELFKYSPYKALNEDQYRSVIEILGGLNTRNANRIFIKGSAGTGKTILATYLIKLLTTNLSATSFEELSEDDLKEVLLVKAFQQKYPNAKIGLVVAMTSLRGSLEKVFRKMPGLSSSMIMSPSDTFALKEKYDLLIVDEAHRLRQYKNIGWMGTFKKNNQKLGLSDKGTELDWIMANSKNQIFFYDAAQSVKPSDIDAANFEKLLNNKNTLQIELSSQMRVKGGNDYISFVDHLLNTKLNGRSYAPNDYDLVLFDSLADLYEQLGKKEEEFGLSRLIAGYSWPWISKTDNTKTDINIDGLKLQWNTTDKDWVNSKNAFREVGCIHTTQGYDLNYAGVIFGEEISYNKKTNKIEIDPAKYFDINGKKGIGNSDDLRAYIINIYKTILYRGIRGSYIYACDEGLRDYLKLHIKSFNKSLKLRKVSFKDVIPYVNVVPLVDIQAAAGKFSELQISSYDDYDWVELPMNITPKPGYFVCKVVGESMNKMIPNNSYCLFRKDEGGTRNGEIVLVEHYNIQDTDFGAGYTVKKYESRKMMTEGGWKHKKIVLSPYSEDDIYEPIVLEEGVIGDLKVVGVFVRVLT